MKQALNTILAALRYYQEGLRLTGDIPPAEVFDIAVSDNKSMSAAGIDALCERLNCGVSLFCYVRVYLRPPGHPEGSPQPAFTHTFIQADGEDAAYHIGIRDEPLDQGLIDAGYAPANDYVIPCGPMLQPAYVDDAALVVVSGGVADVVEGSTGNIRIIDTDNIEAGDDPVELHRNEGFEALLADTDLEEGRHFKWDR